MNVGSPAFALRISARRTPFAPFGGVDPFARVDPFGEDLYDEVYEAKHSKLEPLEGELVRRTIRRNGEPPSSAAVRAGGFWTGCRKGDPLGPVELG